jgi:uncharacterized coiled-coil protein SlyX
MAQEKQKIDELSEKIAARWGLMEKLKDLFLVQCKKCKSKDVEIIPDGYGGEITLICCCCDNKHEM